MERLKETEALLEQCEIDLKRLKVLRRELKSIENNRKNLNKYYEECYMSDYDEFSEIASDFRILDQDSIWNVLAEQNEEKIKILKSLILTI